MMTDNKKVVIAMSGGVDSSVAAALLKKQGYEVTGLMLHLWSETGCEVENRCCTPESLALARRVAAILEIPFYVIDAQELFYQTVVQYFINGYAQGLTPNPCLVCNRLVRWNHLLNHALSIGADLMATGHFARLHKDDSGRFQLLRAIDSNKDQSYVLYVLNQFQLGHTLLPLGYHNKSQVRQLARDFGLPVSERSDSQDLCFLGQDNYHQFLIKYAPQVINPGPILTRKGELLGQHQGLAFYTIGQRKGIGISSSSPLYVIEKDLDRNTLIVGKCEELGRQDMVVKDVNWVTVEPPEKSFRALVKIRYKSIETDCQVIQLAGQRVHVLFNEPIRSITPGQAAVFYVGDVCLGGGLID